eukprot:CAMPEP_0173414426 /NCGR_PEP_ID=MMETSP1356-20130122/84318_1 /TAXON_ID=77927 ORGANISM="Hemiselmis virescens, Strain PCC157" /NCGR_SAMPLE_ID=MMETSP1356 /ASSEMBLY_ACC=CAM_ASM_000847 /LENGTH=312 /DNA_ID=CAMNT_0014376609 /DNA_START=808 /DNA_END=1746 /DNA_ORIENTATION=-
MSWPGALILGALRSTHSRSPPPGFALVHGLRAASLHQCRVAHPRQTRVLMSTVPDTSFEKFDWQAKKFGISAEKLPLFMFERAREEEKAKAAVAEEKAKAAVAEEKAKAAAAVTEEKAKAAVAEKAKAAAAVAEEKAKAAAAVVEEKATGKAAVADEKAKAAVTVAEEKAKAEARENFLKLCLASVQQRFFIERFFADALPVLRTILPEDKRLKTGSPKMTAINLKVSENWSTVRADLGLPANLEWPMLGGAVLYGYLSDRVHNSGMWQLLVGSKTPEDLMRLYEELAKRYQVPLEIVDEESAASGEIEMNQ